MLLSAATIPAVTITMFSVVCVAAVLLAVTMSGLVMIAAANVRSFEHGASVVGVLGLGLAVVSPVFYDASLVPILVRPLIWLSPYTPMAVVIRAVMTGGSLRPEWVAAAIGLACAAQLGAWRVMKC